MIANSIICPSCKLCQFLTPRLECRRCKRSLKPEPKPEPRPEPEPVVVHAILPIEARLGLAVASVRMARRMTQDTLAERMGVPRTYISKIENGNILPTIENIERVARALRIPAEELVSLASAAW